MQKKILVIGAGPIVVGQACEFDYSGCQACKTLKEEFFEVILLNCNPATIMTDFEIADKIYIENINYKNLIKIIYKEKPQFILPTMGGQTSLNCILDFLNSNYNFDIKILGINKKILLNSESRLSFYNLIKKIGFKCPESKIIKKININLILKITFPCIIRSSFTLGGLGSGIAYNYNMLFKILKQAFIYSNEISLDKSIIGWKEYEMEILIDNYNNFVVICCIENIDPVGIHTGDSITITPSQTLSDKEYQNMRDASYIILKTIGLKGGGANIQFAINPINGDLLIIEMNPRISRSAALASKATGYPIAKISTKLSIGYNLIKILNNMIVNNLTAGFEPTIDYVVVKIPKFNFNKFNEFNFLNTVMKSIGEVMSIGCSFQEAFSKAIYSLLEVEKIPTFLKDKYYNNYKNKIIKKILNTNSLRIFYILDAFRLNFNIKFIFILSKIDPWYLFYIKNIINNEKKKKNFFFSLKKIDSCSNEFISSISYCYLTKYQNSEFIFERNKYFLIIGSGSNKIGQSIEFDYSCTKISRIIKKFKFNSLLINCNPETVSTDYDTCYNLYFEPLTYKNIKKIVNYVKPKIVITQFGGQTSLNYSIKKIERINLNVNNKIIFFGSKYKFNKYLVFLNFKKINNYNCKTKNDLIYYYCLLKKKVISRLPNIIGGSLIKTFIKNNQIINYLNNINSINIYIEHFLEDSNEFDIDVIVYNGKIIYFYLIEHLDFTGIHSGDSNAIFPCISLNNFIKKKIIYYIYIFCFKIKISGVINFQICYKKYIYIIECNPRASRTVPYISKCVKSCLIYNYILTLFGYDTIIREKKTNFFFLKKPIFPFEKFLITKLSPEMKSTGEIMFLGLSLQECFFKTLNDNNNNKIHFNNKKIFLFFIYIKKINKINSTSFFKKIFFDLNINTYTSFKKYKKILISDKLLFSNNNWYSNNMITRVYLSSYNKKYKNIISLNLI